MASPEGDAVATLFHDPLSQPSRTVTIFCRAAGIPFRLQLINLGKGENRTPEFKKINPLGKVPYLKVGDFGLCESSAILRYLASTHRVPDHWLPSNPRQRAVVDAAMAWHANNTREGCKGMVWNRAIAPVRGLPANMAVADAAEATLRQALKDLEHVWLMDGRRPFVAGSSVSVADLLISCELEQLRMLDGAVQGPDMDTLLAPHPHVRKWMANVRSATAPWYEEAHIMLGKASARFKQLKQQRSSRL